MTTNDNIFDLYAQAYESQKQHRMSLREYLEGCRADPAMYASTAERMITAIGEPEFVDTAKDTRLGRIFMNRTLKVYPAFKDFYGLEETIERIVGFFRHAAQGLEEKKQILYLLGPVGGGKSSLADRLKDLMEKCPIYVLATNDGVSPIFESALGLFDPASMGRMLEDRYGIPQRLLIGNMSPWAVKRLDEFGGDISKFSVMKLHPSKLRQICVAKTEPGDENNQDISALVGKVDIRKLEHFGQNDADAYSYSGGLNRTTQGVLEFVEMFKAPLKMLHPLLTATQDRTYVGTENVGAMPYQGLIIAHSNESEWQSFRANKNNEAFLDRISVIKVPYCLRVDGGEADLREASGVERAEGRRDRSRDAGDAGALLRADAAEGARELLADLEDARLRRREPQGHRPARQDHPGIPRCGGRHRGHGRRLDAVRLQDPVGDLQLRHPRGGGRPRASPLRDRAGGASRAAAGGDRKRAGSSSSRRSCRRAMPSSSATRSRRPIWNPITTSARTCSTATWPTPTPGSRTTTSRTPTPAS